MTTDIDIDDIDYMDSPSWGPDIHDRFRHLRERDPIHWSPTTNAFLITKYDDVSAISRNQALFTSGRGVRRSTSGVKIGLIDEPEPRHGALRRLIGRGFTPRMVTKLEAVFQALTENCIDEVIDAGECDFVLDLAVPLPLHLIAEMIGIRPEDRGRFHAWSDALIAADGNYDRPDIMEQSMLAFAEYAAYVGEIIEDRRREPREDLVSVLVGAHDEGILLEGGTDDELNELPDDELIMVLVLLLVAGNETTRNAMSGGMQLLIEHPDQLQRMVDDPELIPTGVEEMLRLVSPVHSFTRTVTEDTLFGGVEMQEGQDVLLLYPSANRDGEHFDDPDAFRVDRGGQHLAFGIGPHFCLGASLARMEMRVLFTTLLRRMTDFDYTSGGPLVVPSALVRNCTEMKISFTAR